MPITLQQQPLRAACDLETIAGAREELDAEIAIALKKDLEVLPILKIDAEQAQEELTKYLSTHEKPLKKDTEKWEKIIEASEKKQEDVSEKISDFVKDAALKTSARIICASFIICKKAYAFTWMYLSEEDKLALFNAGISVACAPDETGMLGLIMAWLDSQPIAIMAAHSGYPFDYPKLRGRAARLNVPKARILQPHQSEASLVDTMREYCTYYAMGERKYASLDLMCADFGIPGKPGSGKEVAGLYERGEHRTIIEYCTLDAVRVDQALDKMEIDVPIVTPF